MTTLTMADLQPRVEKGAAWLDAMQPQWFKDVEVDRLQMDGCLTCILGQCFGEYYMAVERLWAGDQHEARDRGFQLSTADLCEADIDDRRWQATYDVLRECWITAILERRARHAATSGEMAQAVDAVAEASEAATAVHVRR